MARTAERPAVRTPTTRVSVRCAAVLCYAALRGRRAVSHGRSDRLRQRPGGSALGRQRGSCAVDQHEGPNGVVIEREAIDALRRLILARGFAGGSVISRRFPLVCASSNTAKTTRRRRDRLPPASRTPLAAAAMPHCPRPPKPLTGRSAPSRAGSSASPATAAARRPCLTIVCRRVRCDASGQATPGPRRH